MKFRIARQLGAALTMAAVFTLPAYGDDASLNNAERIKALKQERAERGNAAASALAGARTAKATGPVDGMRVVKGLGLCVGVFLIGAALYQRLRGRAFVAGGGRLRVLERAALSPKASLVLVEFDGKPLLLAVGSDRVSFHQPQSYHGEDFEVADADHVVRLSA